MLTPIDAVQRLPQPIQDVVYGGQFPQQVAPGLRACGSAYTSAAAEQSAQEQRVRAATTALAAAWSGSGAEQALGAGAELAQACGKNKAVAQSLSEQCNNTADTAELSEWPMFFLGVYTAIEFACSAWSIATGFGVAADAATAIAVRKTFVEMLLEYWNWLTKEGERWSLKRVMWLMAARPLLTALPMTGIDVATQVVQMAQDHRSWGSFDWNSILGWEFQGAAAALAGEHVGELLGLAAPSLEDHWLGRAAAESTHGMAGLVGGVAVNWGMNGKFQLSWSNIVNVLALSGAGLSAGRIHEASDVEHRDPNELVVPDRYAGKSAEPLMAESIVKTILDQRNDGVETEQNVEPERGFLPIQMDLVERNSGVTVHDMINDRLRQLPENYLEPGVYDSIHGVAAHLIHVARQSDLTSGRIVIDIPDPTGWSAESGAVRARVAIVGYSRTAPILDEPLVIEGLIGSRVASSFGEGFAWRAWYEVKPTPEPSELMERAQHQADGAAEDAEPPPQRPRVSIGSGLRRLLHVPRDEDVSGHGDSLSDEQAPEVTAAEPEVVPQHLREIFYSYVMPELFADARGEQDHPNLELVAGQPGAGKSTLIPFFLKELEESGAGAVRIGPVDDFFKFLPGYMDAIKADFTAESLVSDAGVLSGMAISYAVENRYNVVLERAMHDGIPSKLVAFEDKYDIRVHYLAVPPERSRLDIVLRALDFFKQQMDEGKDKEEVIIRNVLPNVYHDESLPAGLEALRQFEAQGVPVLVRDRGGAIFYDSRSDTGASRAQSAPEVVENRRSARPSGKYAKDFRRDLKRGQGVLGEMKAWIEENWDASHPKYESFMRYYDYLSERLEDAAAKASDRLPSDSVGIGAVRSDVFPTVDVDVDSAGVRGVLAEYLRAIGTTGLQVRRAVESMGSRLANIMGSDRVQVNPFARGEGIRVDMFGQGESSLLMHQPGEKGLVMWEANITLTENDPTARRAHDLRTELLADTGLGDEAKDQFETALVNSPVGADGRHRWRLASFADSSGRKWVTLEVLDATGENLAGHPVLQWPIPSEGSAEGERK